MRLNDFETGLRASLTVGPSGLSPRSRSPENGESSGVRSRDMFNSDLHGGRDRDRTIEGSALPVAANQNVGLLLRDADEAEAHVDSRK